MNTPGDQLKTFGDATASSVAAASLVGWLPDIAALAALIYTCLRIWEWFEKRQERNAWFRRRRGGGK